MPEVGLAIAFGASEAIGAERRLYARTEREWVYWYDENNVRYLTATERANAMEAKRKESEDRRVLAVVFWINWYIYWYYNKSSVFKRHY
jgi:hypothetical protein